MTTKIKDESRSLQDDNKKGNVQKNKGYGQREKK
jgi:hypothetical protein